MKRLVNNTRQPQMLESGISLAASGTEGSERLVESISEGDERRLVRRGRISVYDAEGVTEGVTPAPLAEPVGETTAAKTEQQRRTK